MKHLLLTLLLVAFASTCALADSPEAILKDYQKQSAAALTKLNGTLEQAATPLIATLIKGGDTAGAEQLTAQLKAKLAGESVPAPQASATLLFAQYDQARAKALEPAQKAAVARIDTLLSGKEGKDLDMVTALGKVRVEIEAGKLAAAEPAGSRYFVGKSWYSKVGSEYHFNKDGTGYRLQKMDFDDKVAFTWTHRPDGLVEVLQRKTPTGPAAPVFFRFDDKKTAFLGDVITDINSQLRAAE